MLLSQYGSRFWFILHLLASQYPENPNEEKKNDFRQFLNFLAKVFPCSTCGNHFQEFLKENDDKLSNALMSRDKLEEFIYNFHGFVNIRTGKKAYPISLDEVRKSYRGDFWLLPGTDKIIRPEHLMKNVGTNEINNNWIFLSSIIFLSIFSVLFLSLFIVFFIKAQKRSRWKQNQP